VRTTRRDWLASLGLTAAAFKTRVAARETAPADQAAAPGPLVLSDYRPKSMLHVAETDVPNARFPVVDVHCHVGWTARESSGVPLGEATRIDADVPSVVAMMDRRNVKTMVNLTGGYGSGLVDSVRALQQSHPDRFVVFTEPAWDRFASSGYAQWQGDEIARAKTAGARGLKILKTLGLYLREQVTSGPLVAIDDRRFDPMWDACAALGLPVAIHIADPEAFFLPVDRFNERYEELNAHPDWSFHGRDYPAFASLIAARDRLLARHPKTTFIGLHVGHDSENLAAVGESLDRFPNFHVETAARIAELGRQPRAARRFFDRYQDRVLFGTDTTPGRGTLAPDSYVDAMYRINFRFFETDDEYFEYSPSAVPPQGRWRIYGLALPDGVLRKFYFENAERLLGRAQTI
jgi:predicted TIM-barrel fold metal-dependent hydrolase